ncbi:unnamed protein product [Didymodactylos carnosus]|uniref:Arrestin C-terminal-like domain-containing protein n=1 Tax=Didymodactylos carnosus TaxID=1234261 RepID=A0A8S2E735_9BILA|nr:unnamed protein product [Didymodactylos carnosus]CAF3941652.1 unnamed protein product [Didymodactylos carnosus]
MGNNNSRVININLDRLEAVYYGSETISGNVSIYTLKDNNVDDTKNTRLENVNLILLGEISYDGEHSNNAGTFSIPVISAKVKLPVIKEKQEHYCCLFQINLDDDYLPPTLNEPYKYPHVRYYLKVIVNDEKSYEKSITIFPIVKILENSLTSIIYGGNNRKEMEIKGTLNKLGYIPGETIISKIEIKNPRTILLKYIEIFLIEYYQIGVGPSHNENILHIVLPGIMNTTNEFISETFSVSIPAYKHLCPSYEKRDGGRVHVYHVLKIQCKIEGLCSNINITIPIKLGTELLQDAYPPSYDVSEKKQIMRRRKVVDKITGKIFFRQSSVDEVESTKISRRMIDISK